MVDEQRPSGLGWPTARPAPTSEDLANNDLGQTGQDRPVWSLNRDEQRLLWITFIGGLGSIVGAAMLVGVGIVLARTYEGPVFQGQPTPLLIATIALGSASITGHLLSRRWPERVGEFFHNNLLGQTLARLGPIMFVVSLLVWLGLASGIA